MSKWNDFRSTVGRIHDDLFDSRFSAEFFNYSAGTWDPDNDEMTGETRSSIGTANAEIVPPAQDSTIDLQGTDIDWSTSIRFPEDESITSSFKPLGVDNERPTEVEITDHKDDSTTTFELHSYTTEIGSGLIMCRLVD